MLTHLPKVSQPVSPGAGLWIQGVHFGGHICDHCVISLHHWSSFHEILSASRHHCIHFFLMLCDFDPYGLPTHSLRSHFTLSLQFCFLFLFRRFILSDKTKQTNLIFSSQISFSSITSFSFLWERSSLILPRGAPSPVSQSPSAFLSWSLQSGVSSSAYTFISLLFSSFFLLLFLPHLLASRALVSFTT